MSIVNTVTLLQAKHALVTGITKAPITYPTTVNSADLPLVLTTCGPGYARAATLGALKERREDFIVTVLALGVGQANDDQGVQLVHTLLDRFRTLYADPTWYLLAASPHTYILAGEGVENQPHHLGYLVVEREDGRKWHGFQFVVPIMEVS